MYQECAEETLVLFHKDRLSERNSHRDLVTFVQSKNTPVEVRIVLSCLVHYAANALHHSFAVDVRSMTHEVSGSIIVVYLAVNKVESGNYGYKKSVANELHLALCVSKLPVRKAVSFREENASN